MREVETINFNRVEVKLAGTDDPLATQISWNPAKSGGANFKTQKIVDSNERITIQRSVRATLFYMVFVIPGLFAILVGVPYFFQQGDMIPTVFALIWGLLFGGGGVYAIKKSKPFAIDKRKGLYFFGNEYPSAQQPNPMGFGSVKNIHAIQLLTERIRSDSNSFNSFEMNLVFKDGQRLNIMDSGDAQEVRYAAKIIGTHLNIPIWEASY